MSRMRKLLASAAFLVILLTFLHFRQWKFFIDSGCHLEWQRPILVTGSGPERSLKAYYSYVDQVVVTLSRSVEDTVEVKQVADGRFLYPALALGGEWHTVTSWWPPELNHSYFRAPRNASDLEKCKVIERNEVFFFRGFTFPAFQYGHVLHDLLPELLWMAARFPEAKAVLELDKTQKLRSFLAWLDPELFRRTIFVSPEEVVCASSVLFVVPKSCCSKPHHLRIPAFFHHLKQHIAQLHPASPGRRAVYAERVAGAARHGRLLRPADSAALLAAARRRTEVVVFNGTKENRTATLQEQFELFSSASLVFGPHGTAFSNILWMPCPSAVIEFICSAASQKVRGCPKTSFQSYWILEGSAAWTRYFHVFVEDASVDVSDFMRLDMEGFAIAMDKALESLQHLT